MKRTSRRFNTIFREGSTFSQEGEIQIIIDGETGVNYIVRSTGISSQICPLLGRDGEIVIDKVVEDAHI